MDALQRHHWITGYFQLAVSILLPHIHLVSSYLEMPC